MRIFRVQKVQKTLRGPVLYKTSAKKLFPSKRTPKNPPRRRLKKGQRSKRLATPSKNLFNGKGGIFGSNLTKKLHFQGVEGPQCHRLTSRGTTLTYYIGKSCRTQMNKNTFLKSVRFLNRPSQNLTDRFR